MIINTEQELDEFVRSTFEKHMSKDPLTEISTEGAAALKEELRAIVLANSDEILTMQLTNILECLKTFPTGNKI